MKEKLAILVSFSLFGLLCLSCASNWPKDFGSFEQNEKTRAMFETHEYVPEYDYYYTGDANSPEAIVGIAKEYNLVRVSGWGHSTNWQRIGPGSQKLKEVIEAMYPPTAYGYMIYAPGGEQIGVMYSQKWGTVWVPEVRVKAGNRLEVVPHKYNSTWAPAAG